MNKFRMNKKGVATADFYDTMVVIFLALIIVGSIVFALDTMTQGLRDPALSDAGAVNLTAAVDDTLGQISNAALDQANIFSIFLVFGMMFALVINAYMTRDQFPSIFLIIDIIIMIFAYILAVYLSNSYITVTTSVPFSNIFISNMSFSTLFMLNLPKIILVVGALVMIVSYAAIPKTTEESVAGF